MIQGETSRNSLHKAQVTFCWPKLIIESDKKLVAGQASEHPQDLIYLRELVEAGKIKPVIGRTYPLEQIVEAHRYLDTGHKRGNVVITI